MARATAAYRISRFKSGLTGMSDPLDVQDVISLLLTERPIRHLKGAIATMGRLFEGYLEAFSRLSVCCQSGPARGA